jgi:hypothetical protein
LRPKTAPEGLDRAAANTEAADGGRFGSHMVTTKLFVPALHDSCGDRSWPPAPKMPLTCGIASFSPSPRSLLDYSHSYS